MGMAQVKPILVKRWAGTMRPVNAVYPDAHPLTNPDNRKKLAYIHELAHAGTRRARLFPLVVTPGDVIITGLDRLAVAVLKNWKQVGCIRVTVSRDESLALRMLDDINRLTVTAAQRDRFIRDVVSEMTEIYERLQPEPVRISPHSRDMATTPLQHAKRAVSICSGTPWKEVEATCNRANGRERGKVYATSGNPSLRASPLETWGIELDPEWHESINAVKVTLIKALTALRGGSASLTRAIAKDMPIDKVKLIAVHEELARIGGLVRRMIPYALCPWCKGQSFVQSRCEICDGYGWVTLEKTKEAPERLLDKEHPMVWDDTTLGYVSLEPGEP
jgi:hypothetical protein